MTTYHCTTAHRFAHLRGGVLRCIECGIPMEIPVVMDAAAVPAPVPWPKGPEPTQEMRDDAVYALEAATAAQIAPALTPEEWAYYTSMPRRDFDMALDRAADTIAYDLHLSRVALIALANAALPDDDPRKITRDDVDEILLAAQAMEDVAKWAAHGWLGDLAKQQIPDYRAQAMRLLAVHDKLAALLPPES